MKNNITELVFVLDRSGSMASLEDDTIGGFNSMIENRKSRTVIAMYQLSCLMMKSRFYTTA